MYSNLDRPTTTTDFIVDSLRRDILSGKIKAGDRLRQNAISQKFNVSATPVREALKILTAEGLISFDSYKGAIIKGLCYEDAKDIYELRILLEAKLLRDAFVNYDEKYLQKAIKVQEKIRACTNLNEWAILNADFHRCFWESEIGSRTFNIVENLIIASIPYVSLSLLYKNAPLEISNQEHEIIIEAYKNRDLEKLIHETTEHTNRTKKILLDVIQ